MSKNKDKTPKAACCGLELKSILVNQRRPNEQHMLVVARELLRHPALWDNTSKDYHFPSKRKAAVAAAARALRVEAALAGELLRRVRAKYYAALNKMRPGESVCSAPAANTPAPLSSPASLPASAPAWLTLLHKHLHTPDTVDETQKDISEAVNQKAEQLMMIIANHILEQGSSLGRGPHPELESLTGYSSRILLIMWKKIRTLVLEKFAVLCAASDEEGNVPPPARLSPAAWRCLDALLLYELAPAAPQGAQGQIPYEQTGPLIALFHLVQKYKAEEEPRPVPPGGGRWGPPSEEGAAELERLRQAWNDVHKEYLEQGRTQSLVSLQWRWAWCRAAAAAALARAAVHAAPGPLPERRAARAARPPPLLLAVARRFPHVVTGAPVAWAERVQAGRVFLNDAMYKPREVRKAEPAALLLQPLVASDAEPTPADEDDDLILVENEIETIDLEQEQEEPAPETQTSSLYDDLPDILTVDPDKAEVRVIFESDSDSDSDCAASPKVKLESIDEEITKLSESIHNEILGFFTESNSEVDKETAPGAAVDNELSLIDNIDDVEVDLFCNNETVDPKSSDQAENQDKPNTEEGNPNKELTEGENQNKQPIDVENQDKHSTEVEKQNTEIENTTLPVDNPIPNDAADDTTLELDSLNKDKGNQQTEKTVTPVPEMDLTSQINEILRSAPRVPPRPGPRSGPGPSPSPSPRPREPVKHEIDIEEHMPTADKITETTTFKSESLSREVLEYRQNILRGLAEGGSEFKMGSEGGDELMMGSEGGSVAPDDDAEPTIDPKLTMTPRVVLCDLRHVPAWGGAEGARGWARGGARGGGYCRPAPASRVRGSIDMTNMVDEINALFEDGAKKVEKTIYSDELSSIDVTADPAVGPRQVLLNVAKSRSYTTTKLCKNPDFNTRLKRLPDGFFLIDRNRELLSECLPVTIDIQKLSAARTAQLERPGRGASKVSLLSIDDVRRINSRILTAEVTPITAERGDIEIIEVDSPAGAGAGAASDDSDDAMDHDWRPPAQSIPGPGRGRGCGRRGRPPRGGWPQRPPSELPDGAPGQGRGWQPLKLRWGPAGPVFTQQRTINNSKYVATGHKKPALTSLELKRTLRFLEKSTAVVSGGYCCQARRHRAVNDARRRHAARQRRRAPHETRIHTHSAAECSCCCKRLLTAAGAGSAAAAAAAAAASLAALIQAPDAAAAEPDEPDMPPDKPAESDAPPQLWDSPPGSPAPPSDHSYASDPPDPAAMSCARVRPREQRPPKRALAVSTIRKRLLRRRLAAAAAARAAAAAARQAAKAEEEQCRRKRDDYRAWLEERDYASKKFGFKPRQPPAPKPNLKVNLQAVTSAMVVEKPPSAPPSNAPMLTQGASINQGPLVVSSSSIDVVDLDSNENTSISSLGNKPGGEEMATVVRILGPGDEKRVSGGALLQPAASATVLKDQPAKLTNLNFNTKGNQSKPIKVTVKFKEKPKTPHVTRVPIVAQHRLAVRPIVQEMPRLASILGGQGALTQENLARHEAATGGQGGAGEGEVMELSDDDEETPTPLVATNTTAATPKPVMIIKASFATPQSALTPVMPTPQIDTAVTATTVVAKPVTATTTLVMTPVAATVATTTATKKSNATTTNPQRRNFAHCTSLVRGAAAGAPLGVGAWLAAAPDPAPPLLEVDLLRPLLRLGSSAVVASSVSPQGSQTGTLWALRPPNTPPAPLHLSAGVGARMLGEGKTFRLVQADPAKYAQVLFVLSTAQEVRDLVLEGASLYIVNIDNSTMHSLDTVPSSPASCPSPSAGPAPSSKRPPIALNCGGNRRALAHLVHALNLLSKKNQNQDVVSLEDDTLNSSEKKDDKKDRSLLKPDVKVAVKEARQGGTMAEARQGGARAEVRQGGAQAEARQGVGRGEAQKLTFIGETQKALAALNTLRKVCRLKSVCDAITRENVQRELETKAVIGENSDDKEVESDNENESKEENEEVEQESEIRNESMIGKKYSNKKAAKRKRVSNEIENRLGDKESESKTSEKEEESKKEQIESKKNKVLDIFCGISDEGSEDEGGRLMMDIPDDSTDKLALNVSNSKDLIEAEHDSEKDHAMDIEEPLPAEILENCKIPEGVSENLGEKMDVEGLEEEGDCILGM